MPTNKKKTNSIPSRRPARAGNNSKAREKMGANLKSSVPKVSVPANTAKVISRLLIVLVLLVVGWLTYRNYYMNSERVFWSMIDNNLATQGVVRQTNQPSCLPISAEMTNTIQFSFTPTISVHCLTHITNGTTKITVESLGNTTADYQRYKHLESVADNKDYSKIYNMWLANDSQSKLYSLLLTDPVLFGNLGGRERHKTVEQIKEAYKTDFAKTTKTHEGRRPVYTYKVSINLRNFAVAERNYANSLGLPVAGRINPAAYPPNSKVNVVFKVDAYSRQLKEVLFQNISETYSDYGVASNVSMPTKISTQADLQNAFKEANQK